MVATCALIKIGTFQVERLVHDHHVSLVYTLLLVLQSAIDRIILSNMSYISKTHGEVKV